MSSKIVGKKDDESKPRMSLLIDGCPNALLEVGKVLTFGAIKYKDHDWLNVKDGVGRYTSAMIRHMVAKSTGQKIDPESGLSHAAHIACNALFILELELRASEEYNSQVNTEVNTTDVSQEFIDAMYRAMTPGQSYYYSKSTR
jgi:hypothetical protein